MPYKNKEDLIKYRQTEKHKSYKRKYMQKYLISYKLTENGGEIIHKTFTKYNSAKGKIYQKEYKNKRRAVLNQIKLKTGCLNPHCQWDGEFTPSMLDFHHIKPETKSFNVGMNTCRSIKSLEKEIKKCTIVCSNCHRKITAGELNASEFPHCECELLYQLANSP